MSRIVPSVVPFLETDAHNTALGRGKNDQTVEYTGDDSTSRQSVSNADPSRQKAPQHPQETTEGGTLRLSRHDALSESCHGDPHFSAVSKAAGVYALFP